MLLICITQQSNVYAGPSYSKGTNIGVTLFGLGLFSGVLIGKKVSQNTEHSQEDDTASKELNKKITQITENIPSEEYFDAIGDLYNLLLTAMIEISPEDKDQCGETIVKNILNLLNQFAMYVDSFTNPESKLKSTLPWFHEVVHKNDVACRTATMLLKSEVILRQACPEDLRSTDDNKEIFTITIPTPEGTELFLLRKYQEQILEVLLKTPLFEKFFRKHPPVKPKRRFRKKKE